MSRPKIPKETETRLLVASRRRCCFCFGLLRDSARKSGQIAHLDGNSSNNSWGNLAWMCLEHHDEYDGSTSQSKNLTIQEAKHYRDELYASLEDWSLTVDRSHLLNFLAYRVRIPELAEAALNTAEEVTWMASLYAINCLLGINSVLRDFDLILPYLHISERYDSWGLLELNTQFVKRDGAEVCIFRSRIKPIALWVAHSIADSNGEMESFIEHIKSRRFPVRLRDTVEQILEKN